VSSQDARSVKGAYPFRIGVSSRCGGDGLVATFERWRWRVDDFLVHLHEGAPLPGESEIGKLAALGSEALSSFTVQLPGGLRFTSPDKETRRSDAEIAVAAVARTRPLEPRCWVLSLDPPPAPGEEEAWRDAAAESIADIVKRTGVPAGFFAIENGPYDFSIAAKVLSKFGLSACTDVGSLYLHGHDIPGHLVGNLFRSRSVHLHMGRDGRLHIPLAAIPVDHLVGFLSFLFQRHYQSVVTIEVLSEDEVDVSLKAIERAWDRLRQER
jgi:hypothetical protein